MSIIILTSIEQSLSRLVARERHENNRRCDVKDGIVGPQDSYETDVEGAAAELAFCKHWNIYPDLGIRLVSSRYGTDIGDCILQGHTIDVKTSKHRNARLLAVPGKKQCQVEYFALMEGQFPEYIFRGFMSAADLLQPKRLIDLGHGLTYAAEQRELRLMLPNDIACSPPEVSEQPEWRVY